MKKALLILSAFGLALPCFGQNTPNGSGREPAGGMQVGGWTGTKFNYVEVNDDRSMDVTIVGGSAAAAAITRGAPTDRSGTITTGGTSQTLAAALSTRTYIEIQNISDETMYINFGAAATVDSNSFKIVAGGSYINPPNFCPTGTITIIGATTGKKFVAKEG